MPKYGLSSSEFDCLDNIWSQESGWNIHADNPSSSAYGIPQALPGSKMSSAGPDWENNPETQIRWGLGYIQSRYGSACEAWSYKQGADELCELGKLEGGSNGTGGYARTAPGRGSCHWSAPFLAEEPLHAASRPSPRVDFTINATV